MKTFLLRNGLVPKYAKICQDELGISSTTISSVCNGKRKTAGGFKFEFS